MTGGIMSSKEMLLSFLGGRLHSAHTVEIATQHT